MSGGYSGKFSQRQCEIQLPGDNLGEQKVLESAFFRLSKSLKFKILATMVQRIVYTRFITNLPFWAPRRLERMCQLLCCGNCIQYNPTIHNDLKSNPTLLRTPIIPGKFLRKQKIGVDELVFFKLLIKWIQI